MDIITFFTFACQLIKDFFLYSTENHTEKLHTVFAFGKKTNAFSLIVDGEKPELVEIMQSKYKGKSATDKHMIKTLKIFHHFKPQDISSLYDHMIKFL